MFSSQQQIYTPLGGIGGESAPSTPQSNWSSRPLLKP